MSPVVDMLPVADIEEVEEVLAVEDLLRPVDVPLVPELDFPEEPLDLPLELETAASA